MLVRVETSIASNLIILRRNELFMIEELDS